MAEKKKSVYIETTIPSFVTARTSRDTIISGQQAATNVFWESERQRYDLFVSQYVLDECAKGDANAARKRLDFLKGIAILPKTERVEPLADIYFKLLNIPEKATVDALHLAIAVVHRIDYLLSWNLSHMGIASYAKLLKYNDTKGLKTPLLITPESLISMEEQNEIS